MCLIHSVLSYAAPFFVSFTAENHYSKVDRFDSNFDSFASVCFSCALKLFKLAENNMNHPLHELIPLRNSHSGVYRIEFVNLFPDSPPSP